MAPVLPIVGGVLALLLLAGGSGGSGAGADAPPDAAGLEDLRGVMEAAGLPEDWQVFFAAVAWGESRWNNAVGLGPNEHPGRPPWCRPSRAPRSLQEAEARAAASLFRSNAGRFQGSPWPAERYSWGSGGYFGMLPAVGLINGFYATPDWISQVDPWDVCDPVVSVVMAVGYARGLTRWADFRRGGGTWLALRVGWGRPGAMDDYARQADKRPGFAAALAALGVSASFMDRRPSSLEGFPKGAYLLQRIEGVLGLAEAA